MATVDVNRLKGNYGEAYVGALLSRHCLVRPVAEGTDVGLDLYCESIENDTPFLHFWVQVKTGSQCKLNVDESAASFSFEVRHLRYWARQPVPVYAALLPLEWPVQRDPDVYVVDLTSWFLEHEVPQSGTVRLHSTTVWGAGEHGQVEEFVRRAVPQAFARLQCRNGVVVHIPTRTPEYVKTFPHLPVSRFQEHILVQIRRTAAFSVLFLHDANELSGKNDSFRRKLAQIVEQFEGDMHWENFMACALSYHADGQFESAAKKYEEAEDCIRRDKRFCEQPNSQALLQRVCELKGRASRREPLS